MSEPRKTLLEFPCSFPLKVMGKDEGAFEAFVLSIVRRHVAPADTIGVETRPSGAGTYISVTLTFTATSQDQIDAIYVDLGKEPRVLVVL